MNASASIELPADFNPLWSSAMIGPDGSTRRGTDMTLRPPPQGKERTVEYLDAAGVVLDVVAGSFHPYSHIDGGTLLFPEPPAKAEFLRVAGEEELVALH